MLAIRGEPSQVDDWELLARVAGGDEMAFRRLVERHQNRLVAVCERLLGEREAALDAAQEVFLKLWRRAGRLEPRGELFTWLYRVAVNHCLNQLRRRRLARFVALAEEPGERDAEHPDPAAGPDRVLEAGRRWQGLRRAIAALPPSQRVVLVLARLEGLPQREIAATLGITLGAVESRLFRALRALERAQGVAAPSVSLAGGDDEPK